VTERNEPDAPSVAGWGPDGRLFLTAAEVGQQLGVRKSRVYELAASGMLPVVRLGRRMLFPRRGLEELADAAIERARARALSESVQHFR
jgi:excisionase family DNA binding protein